MLAQIPHAWWFFVALQPIAGVVFALDGVLLGAGDAAFLRTATLLCALSRVSCRWCGFPLCYHWGLIGIWSGLSAFMVLRLVAAVAHRSGRREVGRHSACDVAEHTIEAVITRLGERDAI